MITDEIITDPGDDVLFELSALFDAVEKGLITEDYLTKICVNA